MTTTKESLNWFYSGGMAEFVAQPSDVTCQYLSEWFTGRSAYGQAMRLLNLPFVPLEQPILIKQDDELLVDLRAEEATIYAPTIFGYRQQADINTPPHLYIKWRKCLSLSCWCGTWQLLANQAHWLSKPAQIVEQLQTAFDQLPIIDPDKPDRYIQEQLLPLVIATGLVSEFLAHCLTDEWPKEMLLIIQQYISQQVSTHDWFFASLTQQERVQTGEITLETYLQAYGERADRDYELT